MQRRLYYWRAGSGFELTPVLNEWCDELGHYFVVQDGNYYAIADYYTGSAVTLSRDLAMCRIALEDRIRLKGRIFAHHLPLADQPHAEHLAEIEASHEIEQWIDLEHPSIPTILGRVASFANPSVNVVTGRLQGALKALQHYAVDIS